MITINLAIDCRKWSQSSSAVSREQRRGGNLHVSRHCVKECFARRRSKNFLDERGSKDGYAKRGQPGSGQAWFALREKGQSFAVHRPTCIRLIHGCAGTFNRERISQSASFGSVHCRRPLLSFSRFSLILHGALNSNRATQPKHFSLACCCIMYIII